jgi:hypothetical protein
VAGERLPRFLPVVVMTVHAEVKGDVVSHGHVYSRGGGLRPRLRVRTEVRACVRGAHTMSRSGL